MDCGQDEGREGEEVMEKIYERFDFQGLDELLKIRERLPIPERTNTQEVRQIGDRFVNAGQFTIIHSGTRIWQVASADYRLIDHQEVLEKVVANLAELGLDEVRGRVKTWNYGGRMWVECIEPVDFEPLPGDRYNRGFWFKNSYDSSNSLGSGFYALRMICSNGLMAWTREVLVRKIHLGQVKLGDWIRDAIRTMREKELAFEKMIQQAAQVRIEEDLNAVLERLHVGPLVGKKIQRRLESRDGFSAYDLFNAITAFATHDLAEKPLAQENYSRIAQRILVTPEIVVKKK
jgi:hypothetical protein